MALITTLMGVESEATYRKYGMPVLAAAPGELQPGRVLVAVATTAAVGAGFGWAAGKAGTKSPAAIGAVATLAFSVLIVSLELARD